MQGVLRAIAVLLAAGLALGGTATAATQMDASDEPQVEGPLTLENMKCERRVEKARKQTAGVIKRCLRFYRLDPAAESDGDRDYGVVWLQSNVDGRNGWCAKSVASDIVLPDAVDLHTRRPKGVTEVAERKRYRTRLVAQASGTSDDPATIRQTWTAYPKRFRGRVRDEGRIFRLKWRGSSEAKLGFASGIEVSWATSEPPEGISYQLNFRLARDDAC